eukprot:GHVO01019890.1.p1 GENE.GHVO01019890.1~~GHVO01019890.1.p1  ORF type:complete len:265 (+),score=84.88 GHVO01019890.1:355-1149(+)
MHDGHMHLQSQDELHDVRFKKALDEADRRSSQAEHDIEKHQRDVDKASEENLENMIRNEEENSPSLSYDAPQDDGEMIQHMIEKSHDIKSSADHISPSSSDAITAISERGEELSNETLMNDIEMQKEESTANMMHEGEEEAEGGGPATGEGDIPMAASPYESQGGVMAVADAPCPCMTESLGQPCPFMDVPGHATECHNAINLENAEEELGSMEDIIADSEEEGEGESGDDDDFFEEDDEGGEYYGDDDGEYEDYEEEDFEDFS